MAGWKKLGSDSPYGFKNQDFHDQMISCQFYRASGDMSIAVDGVQSDHTVSQYWQPYVQDGDYSYSQPTLTHRVSSAANFYDRYPSSFLPNQWFISSGSASDYSLDYTYFHEGTVHEAYGWGAQTFQYGADYTYSYRYCSGGIYNRVTCRESITMLYEAVSSNRARRLIAATKSKIAVLHDRSGSWRIIVDGVGGTYAGDDCNCASRRFKTAQVGNLLFFTNDFDPVLMWGMDDGPNGCDSWSADYVQDLLDLNIMKVRCIAEWQGFLFLANVEQDSTRIANRIFWSGFNDPTGISPSANSAAGSQDLGVGETITHMAPCGGRMLIYTTKGAREGAIYEVLFVGGDLVWSFKELYRGPDTVLFENSFVNIGNVHYWLSQSGIQEFTEFDRAPHRVEWIHRACGVIDKGVPADWLKGYSGLDSFGPVNESGCDQVVGFYDSVRKCLWFSWPTDSNECANMSLRINLTYQHASLVDHGFTAGVMHRPDYTETLRDFLSDFGLCDPSTLLMDKEGAPYGVGYTGQTFASIRNATEDPDLPVDANSFSAQFVGVELESLCAGCDANTVMVLASAGDKTLKEFDPDVFYRERYVPEADDYDCPNTSPGVYVLDGYPWLVQADVNNYGVMEEKSIRRVLVDYAAAAQTVPSDLSFHIAYGQQRTHMTWYTEADTVPLEALDDQTESEHAFYNTRPDLLATYNFYHKGVFLAWRFFGSGTGGSACYSGVNLQLRKSQGEWDK